MTRFNITLEESVLFVLFCLKKMKGGEIFVPKIPSYKILDVAKAVGPNCEYIEVGIRPGEKLHEEMITVSDAMNTYDIGRYYVILPQKTVFNKQEYIKHFKAKLVSQNFSYNSGSNDQWETVESLRKLIKKHVDSSFETK